MDFKKELEQKIREKEDKFDHNKTKRALIVFLILLAGNTVFFYYVLCGYETEGIYTLLNALVLSFGYCSITYFGYVFLFWKWFEKNRNEENLLKKMKEILSNINNN